MKTVAGKLPPYLDIRGDGGLLILPAGPDCSWYPILVLDLPLAPMQVWMVISERGEPAVSRPPSGSAQPLSKYGGATLDNAVLRIVYAHAGAQETTLNAELSRFRPNSQAAPSPKPVWKLGKGVP